MPHFVHAADIHLDRSLPALLDGRATHPFALAPRLAFTRLIDYVIESDAAFLVLAGDVYDGAWKDVSTGLFFHQQVGRLRSRGVPVYLLHGNHDAESAMPKTLVPPDNIRLFSTRSPQSFEFEPLHIHLHGQSFAQADTRANLASAYPRPVTGCVNIGVLHTALAGSPPHSPYAPCTVEQLRGHGYDYWALGHVHQHKVLGSAPPIVFPGNLQALHIKELGARGAVSVPIEDGHLGTPEFVPLDVLRFHLLDLDVPAAVQTPAALVGEVRKAIESACDGADGRHLAMRVVLRLDAMVHPSLCRSKTMLRDEMAGVFAQFEDKVTLEDTEFHLRPPAAAIAPGDAHDAIASLDAYFAQAARDPAFMGTLRDNLQAVLSKRKPSETPAPTLLEQLANDELETAIGDAADQLRTRLRTID
ncbi:metallophosphoesterase family protein [Metallibacterium scheffleri]|uniref:metallophosphoesterase family protein n=1 Tax=Metallibacterium scheffleri TaxID=993689 RepID=UPI0023F20B63|nr:DNA repair exonuclease [Metallibacterium scheffleri]